jgi:hypothetical protein
MELTSADWLILVDDAFDQMLSKAESLGARVSVVPALPGANSVYAIVTHCVGVCRWWIEHAILGRPTDRDRDAEFHADGTVEELRELVDGLRAGLADLLRAVEATPVPLAADEAESSAEWRRWSWSVGGIMAHVIEELFQHAGHVDITTDLIESS